MQSTKEVPTDVLILGAGAAGLSTAKALSAAGLKIQILEARNRIGGRVLTEYDPLWPVPLELGAEFIHGKPPAIWNELDAMGLHAEDLPDSHYLLEGGRIETAQNFWERLSRYMSHLKEPNQGVHDRSFRAFIDSMPKTEETKKDQEQALAFVEGFHAAETDKISEQSLALIENSDQAKGAEDIHRIPKGYSSLLLQLAWRNVLHLNTVVREVRWHRGQVEVLADSLNGKDSRWFRANKAVLTFPIGVLKADRTQPGAVLFDPPIDEFQKALNGLEMGAVFKLVLCFRERFWEKWIYEDLGFIHDRHETFQTWWTQLPARVPVLTAWSGGPHAIELSRKPETELVREAILSLSRMTGKSFESTAEKLFSWRFHNWQSDPFSKGAYSYIKAGGLPLQRFWASPVEDTLYYAGEAAPPEGETGTVDGAMESGRRAAELILISLTSESERPCSPLS